MIRSILSLSSETLTWVLSVAGLQIVQYLLDLQSARHESGQAAVADRQKSQPHHTPLDASLVDFEDDESW